MASISTYKDGWRVQIYVGGVRESATFEERFQAETWAHERESSLKVIKRSLVRSKRIVQDRKVFLDATDTYSSEDIVASSMSIPVQSGIYFLIREGVIVYVGKSGNVYRRVSDHTKTKEFDRISVIECSAESLDALERGYIKKFKPVLNIVGLCGYAAQDLMLDAMHAGVESV